MRCILLSSSWLVVLGVAWSSRAAAQSQSLITPDDSPQRASEGTVWRERPWSAEGHLGAGTPVGAVGVSLDYSFVPELAMGGGFGMGSGLEGPALHTAAIARLRPVYGDRQRLLTLDVAAGGSF